MTLHNAKSAIGAQFAGRGVIAAPLTRALAACAMERSANDNALPAPVGEPAERLLRAALLHFAKHGLGAARSARAQADAAAMAGDRKTYEWWLGITRTLDRRQAGQVAQIASPQHRQAPE